MNTAAKKHLLNWSNSKSFGDLSELIVKKQGSTLRELSDEELVKSFKKGDKNAFSILLARHQRPIFNFLFKFLNNQQTTEEAFQEVFLRVIRSIDEYKPTAKFTTWIYTIARNYCIDHSRKEKFRRHYSLDAKESENHDSLINQIESPQSNADDIASAHELEVILYQILEDLNPEQKEVFILRETQGLPFDEIAKITNTSTNTVKSRMRYALQTIQKRFVELGIKNEVKYDQ